LDFAPHEAITSGFIAEGRNSVHRIETLGEFRKIDLIPVSSQIEVRDFECSRRGTHATEYMAEFVLDDLLE